MPIPGVTGIDTSRTDGPIRPLAKPRGVPAAFADRVLVDTDDPGVAAVGLGELLGPNRILVGSDAPAVRLYGVRFPSLALCYLEADGDLVIDAPRLPAHQLILSPTSDTARLRTGAVEVESTPVRACCPRPGEPLRIDHAAGVPLMIVLVEQDALRRGVDAILGRSFVGPVTFEVVMDLAQDRAERWYTVLQVLHGEVARAGEGADEVDVLPLESFLVATLLMGHGSSAHEALHHATGTRHNRVLRRVIHHIEANLGDPLAVTDLAAVGRVSVRTLQLHFRESFDQTPTQYVRDKRLDRVHADLQQAGPDEGASVTDIALRWGFHHEGRFAAAYRRRFGETPSATLRR